MVRPRQRALPTRRRSAGRTDGSVGIITTITASTRRRIRRVPRSRRRAAVRIPARSALRSITAIITAARADIRQKPDTGAPLAFEAVKDVVLEITDKPADGWVKVKHRDGTSGFIRINQIWGL